MFQFSRFALFATSLQLVRFPHSEIPGSIHICWSPGLIAAYHVLHRLWEPRHPPCTLSYFLLLMPLLLGHGMSLFSPRFEYWDLSIEIKIKLALSLLSRISDLTSQIFSYLLSSLSIYFFQYVKERFASQIWDLRSEIWDSHLTSHISRLISP